MLNNLVKMQQHRFGSMTRSVSCLQFSSQLPPAGNETCFKAALGLRRCLSRSVPPPWQSGFGSLSGLLCLSALPYGWHVLRTLRNSYPLAAAGTDPQHVCDRVRLSALFVSLTRHSAARRVFSSSPAPIHIGCQRRKQCPMEFYNPYKGEFTASTATHSKRLKFKF